MAFPKGWKSKKVGKKLSLVKIEKQIRKIQRYQSPEVKRCGTFSSNASTFNGALVELMNIPQGLTYSTRVGDQVFLKDIDLRWATYGSVGATASGGNCRLMIFLDTENTGTAPVVADVLQATGTSAILNSPLNYIAIEEKRFHVLYDYTLHGNQLATLNSEFTHKRIRVNRKIHYLDATSTGCTKNRVFLLYCSDVNVNNPFVNFYASCEYTDS